MAAHEPRDFASYTAAAPAFAGPVLKKVHALWRKAAPDAAEVMKWSSPFFQGSSLLGGMAAFKAHVAITLWNAGAIEGAEALFPVAGRTGMGTLKVASVAELPSDRMLLKFFREAVRLDGEGKRAPAQKAPRAVAPKDFAAAMKAVPKAKATYAALSPSCKREYVEWIVEAKRQATREKRIATAVEWLAEGRQRNWRYRGC